MPTVMAAATGSRRRGRRDPPAAAYLAGFVFLGLGSTFAGPALSFLRGRAGTDDAGIGLVFVGSSIGYVIGSLVAGRIVDRGAGHRWWSIAIGVALVAVGVVSATTSLGLIVALFAVLGFMLASCDTSGNTLVLWARPDDPGPLLHGLHLCFAVGALLAPLLVNRALAWSDSLWPLLIPLGLLGAYCVSQFVRRPAPVRTRVAPAAHPGAAAVRTGQLVALCAFFVVYVGVETGVAGWVHSYVEQIGYGGAGMATGVTTIFWTGFVVGRVLAIPLSRRIRPALMLAGALGALIVAATVFVVIADPGIGLWFVMFVIGLVIAPQFASMIAFAEEHLTLGGKATAAFIASAGLGGLVVPWLLGVLFDARGAEVLPSVVLVSALVAAAVAGLAGWLVLRDVAQRPPATSTNAPVT